MPTAFEMAYATRAISGDSVATKEIRSGPLAPRPVEFANNANCGSRTYKRSVNKRQRIRFNAEKAKPIPKLSKIGPSKRSNFRNGFGSDDGDSLVAPIN